jgi:hypothetical protein
MFSIREYLKKKHTEFLIKRLGHRGAFLSGAVRHKIDERYDYNLQKMVPVYDEWKELAREVPNLLTNDGKDYYHAQDFTNTSAGGVGVNFIGLTESTITPAVTDSTLTGEITTNGLGRAIATTLTHSAASNTTTLSKTFTASGSFTSVLASALFNASTSGTMGHIANFSTGSGTLVSGDQLAVTWTMTLS